MNPETRVCQNCKTQFVIESEDFAFYEKIKVPPPTWCPECRFKRRSVFRLERALYKRNCDKCGKGIVAMYHPESPFTVYCLSCYESDAWDPYAYGQEYNPNRPFFEQMRELMVRVPKQNLYIVGGNQNINSEYTNYAGPNKDCYLIFNSGPDCESCFYSKGVRDACKETGDTYFGITLERCYEIVNGQRSNGVVHGQNVNACINSAFLRNCSGCSDCFGCVNLRNKRYCFFNEQLTKEEYEKRVGEIMGSYQRMQEYKERFERFALQFPQRATNNLKATDATGNYIFESNDLRHCFEVSNAEHCRYSTFLATGARDCWDIVGYGSSSELLYETASTGLSNRVIASASITGCSEVEYSFALRQSKNCFGCDGLYNANYAILNRQYSEEEYRKITETIRSSLRESGEYGSFFPPSLALGAYNESLGNDNFPMTRDEALAQGFSWRDAIPETRGKETLAPEDIPDHIDDVSDTITGEVLACIACKRNYRIIPAELLLYRKLKVPIPRQCFNCRHMERLRKRGPLRSYMRECAVCKKQISASYAPDQPEIVYCEQCYQAEVV